MLAYYQTQYSNGTYVSPLPLQGIATDVEVAAFHLNTGGTITLNNDAPSSSIYTQMWSDLAAMQAKGTKVEALLGGAAQGSYADLHSDFATYYPVLRDTLRTYHLDGVDLDIEETFSLADTEKLIKQLRTDFGSGFLITLTPSPPTCRGPRPTPAASATSSSNRTWAAASPGTPASSTAAGAAWAAPPTTTRSSPTASAPPASSPAPSPTPPTAPATSSRASSPPPSSR
ncbi:glycosyl hydrolase family 18 protein [Streptacidiphilus monticola]